MHYVIIGNSAAGVGAIEAIRKHDRKNPITVVSDEPYFTYSRPLISYYLAKKIDEERMFFRSKDFYKKNKVKAILGKKVTAVNPEEKAISLEDKKKIHYDKLLIATGGVPFVPKMEGLDKEGVFTFTKWEDVKRISAFTDKVKNAVVIGGGMIGLKTAGALTEIRIRVTIVELADRVLSMIFDKEASRIIEEHLKEVGMEIIANNTVTEIIGNSKVKGVILKDRKKISCDIVVVAIGVIPNTEIIEGTAIKTNRGIIVNQRMETSIPGIYAAGDVAEAYDMLLGDNRVVPIWPNAREQGRVAGVNMAGGEGEYSGGFPMNSIELCGFPTISLGLSNVDTDEYEFLSELNRDKKIYKKIILKDDLIVGAIFIEAIDRTGIITGLIKDRINVKGFKKDLLKEDWGYVAFPTQLRKERLGK